MKSKVPLLIILLIILVFCIGLILSYNNIIKAEKAVEEAQAQIGVVCQRRLDLIPNLVETVKGYAQHEQTTLIAVTKARGRAETALNEIINRQSFSKDELAVLLSTESELAAALNRLMLVVENYPDLKASSNFRGLQDQLEGTENRIAVARMRYNGVVKDYNTRIAMFPANIVAWLFGFEMKNFFEESIEANEPVEVDF